MKGIGGYYIKHNYIELQQFHNKSKSELLK